MSNQPISASGASAIASSFDWKKRGSTHSGRRFSTSGRIRPDRTVTVLVIILPSRLREGQGEGLSTRNGVRLTCPPLHLPASGRGTQLSSRQSQPSGSPRSEARRVGKGGGSTGGSRWQPYHNKK